MALTLRLVKGTPLTHAEGDANFSGLADGSNWAATVTAALTALTIGSITAGVTYPTSFEIKTQNAVGDVSAMILRGGDSVSDEAGRIFLIGGSATGLSGLGAGGPIDIQGGNGAPHSGGAGGGTITITAGGTYNNALSAAGVSILSGTHFGNGASGSISIGSNSPQGTGNSGAIGLFTGDTADGVSGDIEIATGFADPGTSGTIFLRPGYDEGVAIARVVGAVNYWRFTGETTSNQVRVTAQGADPNIGMNFGSKGTGQFDFRSGNNSFVQFEILALDNAVNRLSVFGGTVGTAAQMRASGSDTNIGILIGSKGTGTIRLATDSGASEQIVVGSGTLTINSATWTIGNDYISTRAAGTVAAGLTVNLTSNVTATGDAGGTSSVIAHRFIGASQGGNDISALTAMRVDYDAAATGLVGTGTCVIADWASTTAGNTTSGRGFRSTLSLGSSGNVTTHDFFLADAPSFTSTGAVTNLFGFRTANLGHATLVTNAVGHDATDMTAAITLTAAFRSQMSSGTGKWGFYASGTANNAFAGNVRIGSVTAPTVALDVTGGITASGNLTLTSAAAQIIPGATSLALRNNANSANNILISDAGAVTIRDDLAVNGDSITTDDTTFNLLNATATTINFGGGATTAINMGNISGDIIFAGATVAQNTQDTNYTLVAADANKHMNHTSASAHTHTIPANSSVAYRVGTAITFRNGNGAGVLSIAITTDTMRLAGAGTTGTRSLAANGIATALKVASTEWIISGTGLT